MDASLDRNNRLKALAGTLLFHGLIILGFIFIVFHNPEPPLFSDTAGVEVNFGLWEEGMGDIQPEPSSAEAMAATASQDKSSRQQEISDDEKILTQEVDDAPALANSEKPKKEKSPEKKITPSVTENKKESRKEVTETVPQKKEPSVNTNALYKGKSKPANEGETGKAGDQGIKEGSLYSKNHGKTMGSGDHGSGDGLDGSGGNGNGKGFSYSLAGRKLFQPPKIFDNSQETGKVVVDITVDKYGNVTNANPGGRGSTTSSANLYKKAKEAALKAKFNPSPEGVEEQRGTITFVFIVQ